ncbi:MAG: ABC transporter ATP-binding protein [Myxococcales bacterium]|jgi:ABC-2 type transport system ATP-binding protein
MNVRPANGDRGQMPAIRVASLVKDYGGPNGVRAVDGIDLEVRQGEIFGLLGPNGAGKTTTIGICTTRVLVTSGTAHVAGVDVLADPALAKRFIGVVTQYNTLDRSCSVFENLYFHARYFGLPRATARSQAHELLARFRLADRARSMPDELSGGMAQRLQVARAISHGPKVLFLDEPTAGLDPQSRLALWAMVRELRAEGTTILLTTHNMAEADALCDRVAIIDHGRILVCDSPEQLKRSANAKTLIELRVDGPRQPLVRALQSLPGVDSAKETAEGALLVTAKRDGMLQAVVEAAHGFSVKDVSMSEPTLETVFIELTGRGLRE